MYIDREHHDPKVYLVGPATRVKLTFTGRVTAVSTAASFQIAKVDDDLSFFVDMVGNSVRDAYPVPAWSVPVTAPAPKKGRFSPT